MKPLFKTNLSYRATLAACCAGFVVQAVVNNLGPLLFVSFQRGFGLSMGRLTSLITINFGIQLLVDLAAARFVDRVGYRASVMAAQVFCAAGFALMSVLPFTMDPYTGLLIAAAFNAVGGGIIEVVVSPIVEALPMNRKSAAMSLLHSFYCWGCVAVVLLSTLFFAAAGADNWRVLPLLWAVLPLGGFWLFAAVPMRSLSGENEEQRGPGETGEKRAQGERDRRKRFLIFLVIMICAGASEQSMAQWASFFAESGLGVSKTLGDILGPCAFSVFMGLGRTAGAVWGLDPRRGLAASSVLGIAGYLLAVFAPSPLLALSGCALTGLGVSVMWPSALSLASRTFPSGGAAMFALLALAGDLGCGAGPSLAGFVASARDLRAGLLAAMAFPALLLCLALFPGPGPGDAPRLEPAP